MAMTKAKALSRMGGTTIRNLAIRNSITRLGCNSIRCHKTEATNTDSTEFKHLSFTEKDLEAEESVKALFERWRRHYDQGMDWDLNEKTKRLDVFKENAKYILKVNKKSRSFKLGLTSLTAMTDEFNDIYCCGRGKDLDGLNDKGDPIEPCGTESEYESESESEYESDYESESESPHQMAGASTKDEL